MLTIEQSDHLVGESGDLTAGDPIAAARRHLQRGQPLLQRSREGGPQTK